MIARNSTEIYKGKPVDVREVGRDLHVGYVLEGSIQRQGDQVRVTAQLIDARSGAHVWAERWDRPTGDLFAAQGELADRVASSLGGFNAIAEADRAVAKRKPPEDLTAYELYLLATEYKHTRRSLADVEVSKRLYDEAIEHDSKLARAYVGRAYIDMILTFYGPPYDFESGIAAMEADARQAIALDPQDAGGHAVLGEALYSQGRFAESVAEFDRALQLNPGSADVAVFAAGILSFMGQPERAAALADHAKYLNPSFPPFYPMYLGPAYFFAGRMADVISVFELIPPEQRLEYGWVYLAAAHAMLDQMEQATIARDEALKVTPTFSAEAGLASNWLIAGEQGRKLFIDGVRRAGLPVCADPVAATAMGTESRLPECEAERARTAAAKS